MNVEIENKYVKYVIGSNGVNLNFLDKLNGKDYCKEGSSCAKVKIADRYYNCSSVVTTEEQLSLEFGEADVKAVLRYTEKDNYIIIEVLSVESENPDKIVDEFVFANIQLKPAGESDDALAGCALALNLQTNVVEIPRDNTRLRAMCYPRFGFAGAKVAIIGCPQKYLRFVMQEVVTETPELPKSNVGGPWALDSENNRGSYMFNFGGLSEENVDDWIALAKKVGVNQIDFHGGNSFRFGDCRPNPETYPNCRASFKAVIDKLHEAGILAGFHTYAFFIAKDCPWVTPVPDPGLAKDATFTLSESITVDTVIVPVEESTESMSTVTGFFVRNSVTIQIEDELITYSGISKEKPYAFTNCNRGAYGTKPAQHDAGARVHHLKECFGLFAPDPDSDLFYKVAETNADMYNECGFDMMYLDALDGEDVLGGGENSWHYGSKFVFELVKRAKKSPIMEMSTFHHHLWYVRARMGAWDHPTRSHKRFIDVHCSANEDIKRMFLPPHLGWWAVKTWTGHQGEPTFADDIEYLCCKCIGTEAGLSIMGITPDNISQIPAYERLSEIMRQYEMLRRSNYFSNDIKEKLKVPGDEYTLKQRKDGSWYFLPIQYVKHKVEGIDGWSNRWSIDNKFQDQPLKLRIEALTSADNYGEEDNPILLGFESIEELTESVNFDGISAEFSVDKNILTYSAKNIGAEQKSSWCMVAKKFPEPLNLTNHQGIGIWVNGDGKGEILNVQLKSPQHISHGIEDHYITINFTGWRYFELIEPEGERYAKYKWPYGSPYAIYRESVNYSSVESISLWYNNIPDGESVTCLIKPVKAIKLTNNKIVNPSIKVENEEIIFPVKMETGQYLEFNRMDNCKLFGTQGETLSEVLPKGQIPLVKNGKNYLEFRCDSTDDSSSRVRITVISTGKN
ncbi:hypothetical protein GF312_02290 [Candidatus Poribacteria bacterium]|nr:hypothetical protein [Candidatus Poribacteria bacterium]